jgi:hypothetical protein
MSSDLTYCRLASVNEVEEDVNVVEEECWDSERSVSISKQYYY